MAEQAFNPENCEIEAIDRIPPCAQMLSDDTVPEPPEPIGGCAAVDLRNIPDPGCPEIYPPDDTPGSLTYVDGPTKLRFGFTKGAGCIYTLDIEGEIHRPLLTPTALTTVDLYTANGVTGYVKYKFTMTGESDYALSIDALVPCTWITPQTATYSNFTWGAGPTLQSGGIGWYFAKNPAACDYTLNMNLIVPCPQIRHTTAVHINYHEVADSASAGHPASYPEPYVANGRLDVTQPVCNDWYWTLTLNLQEPGVLWQNTVAPDVGIRSISEADNASGIYFAGVNTPARNQVRIYPATIAQNGAVTTSHQYWRGLKTAIPASLDDRGGFVASTSSTAFVNMSLPRDDGYGVFTSPANGGPGFGGWPGFVYSNAMLPGISSMAGYQDAADGQAASITSRVVDTSSYPYNYGPVAHTTWVMFPGTTATDGDPRYRVDAYAGPSAARLSVRRETPAETYPAGLQHEPEMVVYVDTYTVSGVSPGRTGGLPSMFTSLGPTNPTWYGPYPSAIGADYARVAASQDIVRFSRGYMVIGQQTDDYTYVAPPEFQDPVVTNFPTGNTHGAAYCVVWHAGDTGGVDGFNGGDSFIARGLTRQYLGFGERLVFGGGILLAHNTDPNYASMLSRISDLEGAVVVAQTTANAALAAAGAAQAAFDAYAAAHP